MPIYQYTCKCGYAHDRVFHVAEYKKYSRCPLCGKYAKRSLTPHSVKVFRSQVVSATLTDSNGEDVHQYVRNKQELTDAINRYNDTERASKTGKVAILE